MRYYFLFFIITLIAGQLEAQLDPVLLEKLPSTINTEYDEISPVLSDDGQTLYFTRSGAPSFRKAVYHNGENLYASLSYIEYEDLLRDIYSQLEGKSVRDPIKSEFNQDIWIAENHDGEFSQVYQPAYPLNNALPNSVCAVLDEENEVVVINHFYRNGSMYKGFSMSTFGGNNWSFPEPLYVYDFNNSDPGVNMTLSHDAEIMILSMSRADSDNKNDLFVSFRIHKTLWSTPVSLGDQINTSYKEMSPFISRDKKFLFFSSDRPGGLGGNDIYVTQRIGKGWQSWTEPKLLAEPINSTADDAQPYFSWEYLYFTSTRDGSSDIFRMPFRPHRKKLLNNNKFITINILDSNSGYPVSAKLLLGNTYNDRFTDSVSIGKNGGSLQINSSAIVRLKPVKKGYITKEHYFDPKHFFHSKEKREEIILYVDPIVKNAKIHLDPVYFVRSQDQILKESYQVLNELVEILKKHPELHIQIEGHTDNVGEEEALFTLSEKRAAAVKRYLTRSGIHTSRINIEGYGASDPVTDNSTEEKKARNRRVEFIITKV